MYDNWLRRSCRSRKSHTRPAGLQRRRPRRSLWSAFGVRRVHRVEHALLQDAERCERGELSDQERIALADKLADRAKEHLWRAHALSKSPNSFSIIRICLKRMDDDDFGQAGTLVRKVMDICRISGRWAVSVHPERRGHATRCESGGFLGR